MGSNNKSKLLVYFALPNEQFTTLQLLKYGIAAEKAGFDGIWTSDHFQPWQPNEGHAGSAWVLLAALTQRTSRIQLGTGVTCPAFRYTPAIIAQNWASLSLLAPGRIYLGVGLGENLNEGAAGGGWAPYEERACRVTEAIRIIRDLWSGDHVQYKGETWAVDGKLYDPPATKIPLYIAATAGPKSARLSGLYGDGLITSGNLLKSNPELKAAWEDGVRESGGDPRTRPILVEHWAMAGNDQEAREAAEKWRFIVKAWTHGYYDNISPLDIQRHSEKEIKLEDVLKQWTVSNDPKIHLNAIKDLIEHGVTHIVIHSGSPNQLKTIDFFAKEVLPVVRSGKII
ncbi:MAG: TIGR03557 family F420-dependent LLM class oxidoreductase [Candidatus Bathyarchaeia archaeon]|jgi:TAT-translocated FGD2 family F420-dependent dehydrogenase